MIWADLVAMEFSKIEYITKPILEKIYLKKMKTQRLSDQKLEKKVAIQMLLKMKTKLPTKVYLPNKFNIIKEKYQINILNKLRRVDITNRSRARKSEKRSNTLKGIRSTFV